MAAAMVVLSPLLVGTWEASRLVEVNQVLANAAREGGAPGLHRPGVLLGLRRAD